MKVPKLTLWMVRVAMIYLALGFTIGALYLVASAYPFSSVVYRLLPAHIEFLIFGWSIQLAMGVAFSIMPRFEFGASRGNEALGWAAFWLLNPGVLLVALSVFLHPMAMWQFFGRVLEIAGMACFVAHLWPRVKPVSDYPPKAG